MADLGAGDGVGAVEPGVVHELAVHPERAGEPLVGLELRVHAHGSPGYDRAPATHVRLIASRVDHSVIATEKDRSCAPS
jgi:hypothetical protein